jgi:outer membrane protein assembly factor BamB
MKLTRLMLVAILASAVQTLAQSADNKKEPSPPSKAASDWPIFRGNALQTGVAGAPLPDSLTIRWKFKAKDSIEGSAAIANGLVYIGAMEGSLYALDLATGKAKWTYKAGPIKGGPSFHDSKVFVGDADGIFHCVDANTGKKLWTYDASGEVTSGGNFSGNTVIFGAYDEHLRCLSLDGKELWKFNVPGGPVLASPVVAAGRTYVSGCDSTLHVIDTKTGKELGAVQLEGQTGASAAVVGDDLYVGTMSNQMLAIDLKKEAIKWKYESAENPQPFFASPAVSGDLVIVGCRDKRVHAFVRQTGKPAWEFATEGKVDSSPVIAGKRVYVGSQDGNLYVLDLAGGTLVQKINLGGPISASPAVAANYLVIGTQNGIVYGLGKEE